MLRTCAVPCPPPPLPLVFALWQVPQLLPCLVTYTPLRYVCGPFAHQSSLPPVSFKEPAPHALWVFPLPLRTFLSAKILSSEDTIFLPGVVRGYSDASQPPPQSPIAPHTQSYRCPCTTMPNTLTSARAHVWQCVGRSGLPRYPAGAKVALRVVGNPMPFAVGVAEVSSKDAEASGAVHAICAGNCGRNRIPHCVL
jgi:hypothetical protein